MKSPDAVYINIETRLDWIDPPMTVTERARRELTQTSMKAIAAQASAELSTLFTELLKGGE